MKRSLRILALIMAIAMLFTFVGCSRKYNKLVDFIKAEGTYDASDKEYSLFDASSSSFKIIMAYLEEENTVYLSVWNPATSGSGYYTFTIMMEDSKGKYFYCYNTPNSDYIYGTIAAKNFTEDTEAMDYAETTIASYLLSSNQKMAAILLKALIERCDSIFEKHGSKLKMKNFGFKNF